MDSKVQLILNYYKSLDSITPRIAQGFMKQAVEEVMAIQVKNIGIPYSKLTLNSETFREKYKIRIDNK